MKEKASLKVIIPAFNEGPVIAEVIQEIQGELGCEVVVVNDGSEDDTIENARAAGAIVISHPINRGAGAACQTGIELARRQQWPLVAFMDADGQHVPKDLEGMIEAMKQTKADLVIGSRFMNVNKEIPFSRRFFNTLANILTNTFCKQRYTDTQSGFRLLNEQAIRKIDLFQDDFSFCSEMIIQAEGADLTIVETPIDVRYTDYSVSKGQDFQVGLLTAFHFLWKLIFK